MFRLLPLSVCRIHYRFGFLGLAFGVGCVGVLRPRGEEEAGERKEKGRYLKGGSQFWRTNSTVNRSFTNLLTGTVA